jgi:hypothetical protein
MRLVGWHKEIGPRHNLQIIYARIFKRRLTENMATVRNYCDISVKCNLLEMLASEDHGGYKLGN